MAQQVLRAGGIISLTIHSLDAIRGWVFRHKWEKNKGNCVTV